MQICPWAHHYSNWHRRSPMFPVWNSQCAPLLSCCREGKVREAKTERLGETKSSIITWPLHSLPQWQLAQQVGNQTAIRHKQHWGTAALTVHIKHKMCAHDNTFKWTSCYLETLFSPFISIYWTHKRDSDCDSDDKSCCCFVLDSFSHWRKIAFL